MKEYILHKQEETKSEQMNYTYIFRNSGLVLLLIGLYYTQKRFFLEQKEYNDKNEEPIRPQNIPKRVKRFI